MAATVVITTSNGVSCPVVLDPRAPKKPELDPRLDPQAALKIDLAAVTNSISMRWESQRRLMAQGPHKRLEIFETLTIDELRPVLAWMRAELLEHQPLLERLDRRLAQREHRLREHLESQGPGLSP